MRHWIPIIGVGIIGFWLGVEIGFGQGLTLPAAGPERILKADCILVGRVVALEDKEVELALDPKGPKTPWRVAVVKINEPLKAPKDAEIVRVGFSAAKANQAKPGVVQTLIVRVPQLQPGQDGLFYLLKHPKEDIYVITGYQDFISSQNVNFSPEVKLAKFGLKNGENLPAVLKSESPEDRFLAAALLVQKYRSPKLGGLTTEPIDATESKLILKAILEADWKQTGQLSPYTLFNQLGLTQKDGWNRPTNVQSIDEVHQAAQNWLKEHLDSYRIQRRTGEPKQNSLIRPLKLPLLKKEVEKK